MGQQPNGSDPPDASPPGRPPPGRPPADAPSAAVGFGSLFEHHPDVVYEMTRDGVIVRVNRRDEERAGYPPEQIIGGTYHPLVHEDDRPLADAEFARAVGGETRSFEVQGVTIDGQVVPTAVTLVPNVDHATSGEVVGVFTIVRDLVRERRMTAERDEALEQLDQLVTRVGTGLSITDAAGRYVRVNPVYRELVGYSEDELLAMTIFDVVHPDDFITGEALDQRLEEGALERITAEQRFRHASGEMVWVRATLSAIRDANGAAAAYISACEDISDRKAAEAALEEAAWLRREAGRLARFGAWSVTFPGWEVAWSGEIFDILGIPVGQPPTPEEALRYYAPTSRRVVSEAIERCGAHGEPFDLEATIITDAGEGIDVRVAAEAQLDESGNVTRVIGTFQDITSLKRATEASRRSAEQLEATLQRISEAVISIDAPWRFTYLNPAGERLTGRDRDDLIGRVMWEEFPELLGSDLEGYYRQAVEADETIYADRLRWPGSDSWYRIAITPTEDGGLTVYAHNISAQVREEQRLREMASTEHAAAEELRSLDRMKNAFIAAVSHELRTPLTVVRGMADTLLRLREDPDPVIRERLEDALADHAARLSDLLDDLLDTDRLVRGVLRADRQPAELVAMVRAAIDASVVADRVHLTAPDHLDVEVDVVLVERSLRNLLENVGKYAPDGRVEVTVAGRGDGGFVLRVRDQGPGIPAGQTERVFEPFHRVLDHPQPGTGVGLSLVAEFAHLHGGRAYVDTEVVDGTCIVIEVPGD